MLPEGSVIAISLLEFWSVLAVVTPALAGSTTCPKPSKYVTTPGVDVIVTFPVLLGRGPMSIGPSLFELKEDLTPVKVRGAPAVQLRIPDICQFSTIRDTMGWAFARNARFGPKGNMNVPLLVI
jgi:hypothetical protein